MKRETRNKILLLTITFFIVFSAIGMLFNSQSNQLIISERETNENIEINVLFPKISAMAEPGSYPNSTITIDETAEGVDAKNWTWAVAQDWCSGVGTSGDPYVIVIDLACNSSSPALLIESTTTKYFKIENSSFANWDESGIGLMLNNTNDGVIENTDAGFNGDVGIKLQTSDNITINNCDCHNNTIGLSFVVGSDNCTIYQLNNFYNNTNVGIYVEDSSDNEINGNIIEDNTNYGIVLVEDALNNTGNSIFNNTLRDNGINAVDNSTTANTWDNGVDRGNVWDDYSGFDLDDNGIGDSYYSISGSANARDRYPIYSDGVIGVGDSGDEDNVYWKVFRREIYLVFAQKTAIITIMCIMFAVVKVRGYYKKTK